MGPTVFINITRIVTRPLEYYDHVTHLTFNPPCALVRGQPFNNNTLQVHVGVTNTCEHVHVCAYIPLLSHLRLFTAKGDAGAIIHSFDLHSTPQHLPCSLPAKGCMTQYGSHDLDYSGSFCSVVPPLA